MITSELLALLLLEQLSREYTYSSKYKTNLPPSMSIGLCGKILQMDLPRLLLELQEVLSRDDGYYMRKKEFLVQQRKVRGHSPFEALFASLLNYVEWVMETKYKLS